MPWLRQTIVAIECVLTQEGIAFNGVECVLRSNQLELIETGSGDGFVRKAMRFGRRHVHAAVAVVSSSEVLTKVIEVSAGTNPVRQAFPHVNEKDFVTQTHYVAGKAHVSIMRQTRFEEVLTKLTTLGFPVETCFLSPFYVVNYMQHFESDPTHETIVRLGRYLADVVNATYTFDGTVSNQTVILFGQTFQGETVIPYLAAVEAGLGHRPAVPEHPLVVAGAYEITYRNAANRLVVYGLTLLTTLLVCGLSVFFVFNALNAQRSIKLNTDASAHARYASRLQAYRNSVSFLQSQGLMDGGRVAFFSDRLAQPLPDAITLTQLWVHPAKENWRPRDGGRAFEPHVLVRGQTHDASALNRYIDGLRKTEWVSSVTLVKMQTVKDNAIVFDMEVDVK